jgi:hypothetical protein
MVADVLDMQKRKKHSEETKRKIATSHMGIPPWNKGMKTSAETKAKISKANKGNKRPDLISFNTRPDIIEKRRKFLKGKKRPDLSGSSNPNWKGGITPINLLIRSSLEYRLWRISVFERDGYVCIFGGKEHGNKLIADHIKPFCLFPELRFAIDNGRTLCRECHKLIGWKGGHIKK